MPTDFNIWRKLIKESVESIADEKYQRQEWFENKSKTWFFPTEMFSSFFDNAAAEDFFNNDKIGRNESQKKAGINHVKTMRALSVKYPRPDNMTNLLIDDPLMVECRIAAKQFLVTL